MSDEELGEDDQENILLSEKIWGVAKKGVKNPIMKTAFEEVRLPLMKFKKERLLS